jgi:hypothetical protein
VVAADAMLLSLRLHRLDAQALLKLSILPCKLIFCGSDGEWKDKLEKCLQTDDRIVLLALGSIKYEVSYLNKRKDIEIVKLETRCMKKREKGVGVKVTVRSCNK